jgi:membrane-associated phospholipid phosphatase
MNSFFREHKAYFLTVGSFILTSLVLLFFIKKGDIVIFFSENRSDAWNMFFVFANKLGEEWTYLIGLLSLLFFKKIRYALFIFVTGTFTMLLSSGFKTLFAHQRPKMWAANNDILLNFVPDVYVNVGYTSFPSGHTFSAFAIFGYFALVSKSPFLKVLFAICAILGGLARIYLSQHFLEDILFGGFLGILLATGVYYWQSQLNDAPSKWWNKRLFRK